MRICVVIVNYRTARLVLDCLDSMAQQLAGDADARVVVVDNASGDGSVEQLSDGNSHRGLSARVSLLPQSRNGGFAYGNNAGIRHALSHPECEFVFLLNPDTVVRSNCLGVLVRFMESHHDVGICGSGLENAEGALESSAHNAPSPLGELESAARLGSLSRMLASYAVTPPARTEPHECEWVSGAGFMVRRKVIEEIGFLDDGYFLYFEEVDFCVRARQVGWQVWFVPDSRVVHFEGSSTDIGNTARRRPQYWYDSRRRYFLKHFGLLGLLAADSLWALGRLSLQLRRLLGLGYGGGSKDPKWFAFDLLIGDLRAVFTGKGWRSG